MPQKRRKTGFRGPSPDVGKATQFKPGNRANPGGRPKKTKITDATREWLESVDPKTGKTNAELVVEAQGRQARKGNTGAFNALGDRSEGKPAQSITIGGSVEFDLDTIDARLRHITQRLRNRATKT